MVMFIILKVSSKILYERMSGHDMIVLIAVLLLMVVVVPLRVPLQASSPLRVP